jgi:hypothetical protein
MRQLEDAVAGENVAADLLKRQRMSDSPLHSFTVAENLHVAYIGPKLEAGPLPALFYFSLSAEDSLLLDPFNQPVTYLSQLPMRIFSLTLPGHENQLPPTQALDVWAREILQGNNVIAKCIDQIKTAVEALAAQNAFLENRLAVAGLSRGAFIATHAAAVIPQFQWILGFAPLTTLVLAKEFEKCAEHPVVQSLALNNLIDKLLEKKVRFYIGNVDTRVGTRACFDFIEKLAETSFEKSVRSPPVELFIRPSIGRDGHGTSKEIFHEGAHWIAEQLGAIDVL